MVNMAINYDVTVKRCSSTKPPKSSYYPKSLESNTRHYQFSRRYIDQTGSQIVTSCLPIASSSLANTNTEKILSDLAVAGADE